MARSYLIQNESHVNYIFFSLLQNQKLFNIHCFSALTLGLKKDDIGFMPVLSTLARLFWAALIFLGGWNKGKETSTWWLDFARRQQGIHYTSWTSIQAEKNTFPQGKPL